jgi:hypothetical protein
MKQLSRKQLICLMYGTGLVFLGVSGWLWWNRIETNPERAFWSMVNQSMSTKSATIEATQDQSGTVVRQTTQFTTGNKARAHGTIQVNQGTTLIRSEVIGDNTADYNRYTQIKTEEVGATGKKIDGTKLVGLWAKSATAQGGGDTTHKLLARAVLGIDLIGSAPIPIADFTSAQRDKLITLMHDSEVYQVDYKHVAKSRKDGRLMYTYDVTMQPIAYVRLMKQFAKEAGMKELESVEPNGFHDAQKIVVKMTVDVHAHRLVTVGFEASGFVQSYTYYDIPMTVGIPAKTMSYDDLQKRLQEL